MAMLVGKRGLASTALRVCGGGCCLFIIAIVVNVSVLTYKASRPVPPFQPGAEFKTPTIEIAPGVDMPQL